MLNKYVPLNKYSECHFITKPSFILKMINQATNFPSLFLKDSDGCTSITGFENNTAQCLARTSPGSRFIASLSDSTPPF